MTEPIEPQEITQIFSEYTCDRCGKPMPDHNQYGGLLHPLSDDETPRSKISVYLEREHFTGDNNDDMRLNRDYCDECLPPIWKAIESILAYPPG